MIGSLVSKGVVGAQNFVNNTFTPTELKKFQTIGDIGTNFSNTIKNIVANAQIIGFAAAALIVVVSAILFFTGDDQTARAQKKKWIRVFVGVLLLVGVYFFVNWAKTQGQNNFGG